MKRCIAEKYVAALEDKYVTILGLQPFVRDHNLENLVRVTTSDSIDL